MSASGYVQQQPTMNCCEPAMFFLSTKKVFIYVSAHTIYIYICIRIYFSAATGKYRSWQRKVITHLSLIVHVITVQFFSLFYFASIRY